MLQKPNEMWREEALRAGRRLRVARLEAGFSQESAAMRIGVSRPTITWIENGRQHVTLEVLWALCLLYNVTPEVVVALRYTHLDSERLLGWPSLDQGDDGKKS